MVKLTERERMLRTYKRQEVDRVPMYDRAWRGTRRRWKNEGVEGWWEDYFGFDHLTQVCPDNSPRFERKVLEETDRYRIVTTKWGVTQKEFKELDSTPEMLDFYYCDSDRWEEAKAKMLQYHEDRIPWETLKQNAPIWEKEGRFRQLVVWHGFDVAHSHMIGTENVLIGMYEEPEWIKDVIETYLTTSLDLC